MPYTHLSSSSTVYAPVIDPILIQMPPVPQEDCGEAERAKAHASDEEVANQVSHMYIFEPI